MKKVTIILVALLATISMLFAQKQYKFETVPNDPLNARIYKLENGLVKK